jgi:cytochrome c556
MKLKSVVLVSVVALALGACAKQEPAKPVVSATAFQPTASIIDLMSGQVDPAADFLWESVATTSGPKGREEKQPRTEDEWAAVRRQALIVIEAGNLLMMEGRVVAHPGQKLENPPGPGDLTPEQSLAAITADRATFNAYARAFQDAGLLALRSIEARNVEAFLEAGGVIDEACEQCHKKFWYPGGGAPPAGT